MTEVELKARLTEAQAAGMAETLASLGFAPKQNSREVDVYFNGNLRDFRKSDEALRLRSRTDLDAGATETLWTYKGPKADPRSNTRTEYETAVGELEIAKHILESLGFEAAYTVEKVRREVQRGSVTVCLDQVTGLGAFMELEILLDGGDRDGAVESLLALLDTLGVSREALSRKSYLELLIASATV